MSFGGIHKVSGSDKTPAELKAGDIVRHKTTGEYLQLATVDGDAITIHALEPQAHFEARHPPEEGRKEPPRRLTHGPTQEPFHQTWPPETFAVVPEEILLHASDVELVRAATDDESYTVLRHHADNESRLTPCPACATRKEHGHPDPRGTCITCQGTGAMADSAQATQRSPCPICAGTGYADPDGKCDLCGGTEKAESDRRVQTAAETLALMPKSLVKRMRLVEDMPPLVELLQEPTDEEPLELDDEEPRLPPPPKTPTIPSPPR
jgi:hypothetical protein